jgi:ribonucleoside-diphosphate reductase alpha chain
MVHLSPQAEVVAKKRYYLKNDLGETIENAEGMFKRVAKGVASIETLYNSKTDTTYSEKEFYRIMAENKFLPNSPTLMNAGTDQGTLSACFVLPVKDSMEGIMKAATDSAMVQKFGGGTGFALSELRPRGDMIKTTHGIACGPIEVLKTLSRVSSMITQGGKRDGANMAVMDIHHPDILEFIDCKQVEGEIHNFNISVGVTNDFMAAVKAGTHYSLIHPTYKNIVGELNAREVFRKIVHGAWRNGEPGMVFLDRINEDNSVQAEYGSMIATNPCGEQPLLPNESCNLGSINLAEFFNDIDSEGWEDKFNWPDFKKTVHLAIRFLDDVVDANKYATKSIETMTKATRKVGLGIMGFADLLIQMKVAYNSKEGREIGAHIMRVMKEESDLESARLAEDRGNFPSWEKSTFEKPMRNACRLTVAPTGTISMLANTSSGIEPTFALAWKKQNVLEGESFYYTNKYFEEEPFVTDEILEHVSAGGSLDDVKVEDWVKEVYVTSAEIAGDDHVLMQAAFQEHCDSGISKTINLPNEATEEDVATAYLVAYDSGCKGITVYRSGSRDKEVLVRESKDKIPALTDKYQLDLFEDYLPNDGQGADKPPMWNPNDYEPYQLQPLTDGYNFWATLSNRVVGLTGTTNHSMYHTAVAEPDIRAVKRDICCDSPMLVEESGCTSCKSCGWSKCHIA